MMEPIIVYRGPDGGDLGAYRESEHDVEYAALTRADFDALVKQRDVWMLRATTGGVAELGVFNPNVASYCRELEARAEKAEAQRDAYISGREMQRDRADAATARADKAEKDRDDAVTLAKVAVCCASSYASDDQVGCLCVEECYCRAGLLDRLKADLARIDAALEEKK